MLHYTGHAYLIECLSNLHVGSSGENYGVIDKQVQRDTVTEQPIIHASGLKGALREYFENCTPLTPEQLAEIFGSDKTERDKLQQGAYRFFDARLLSLPVRAVDHEVFYRATNDDLLLHFNTTAASFSNSKRLSLTVGNGQAATEFGAAQPCAGLPEAGDKLVALPTAAMKEALHQLPIIARNSLDNGQSENLWYEEVVPRYSRFYFFVAVPGDTDTLSFTDDFNKHLDGKMVQIGANATVGYGHCKITKIS